MSKIAASAVGLLLLPTIALAQQPTLTVGWLSYSAGTISQDLSIQNDGQLPMTVRIGCRFSHSFKHYSKQLGAGTGRNRKHRVKRNRVQDDENDEQNLTH